jgi:hypothetical protein
VHQVLFAYNVNRRRKAMRNPEGQHQIEGKQSYFAARVLLQMAALLNCGDAVVSNGISLGGSKHD